MSERQRKHSSDFHAQYDTNTYEYLAWRRLHLSKSKLSGVAELASFMAGFAVVATVELQINDGGSNPILLTVFVVTTAILVATSMLVILISTCILPQLEAVTKIAKCPSPEVTRSPHDSLVTFIDLSWILANTVSLFLFTLDVILVCWIKWTYLSPYAPVAASVIMGPVLLAILIFGVVFYRKIIKHQHDIFSQKYCELEEMQRTLEAQIERVSLSFDDLTLESDAIFGDLYSGGIDDLPGSPDEVRSEGVPEDPKPSGHRRSSNASSVVYQV